MSTRMQPKILLTTSRDPSQPLTQFAKELKLVFPNSQRMNCGGQVARLEQLSQKLLKLHVKMILQMSFWCMSTVVMRHDIKDKKAVGCSQVMRHDIKDKKAVGKVSEAYPRLILHNFKTQLGQRTGNILKPLFPVPKPDSKRIMSFVNQSDTIIFRHHVYQQLGGSWPTVLATSIQDQIGNS